MMSLDIGDAEDLGIIGVWEMSFTIHLGHLSMVQSLETGGEPAACVPINIGIRAAGRRDTDWPSN